MIYRAKQHKAKIEAARRARANDMVPSQDVLDRRVLEAARYQALEILLERYVGLVNCGDCGNWNPEQEEEVISARAVLAKARGEP
jgi:hypothetical protein